MKTISVDVALTVINCGCCGGIYAINERFREKCQEDGKTWSCPYCKVGWGYAKGTNAKLKEEIERQKLELAAAQKRERDALAEAEHFRKSRDAERKKMDRVKAGVCPCCNRSFQNLARHMKSKHSEK